MSPRGARVVVVSRRKTFSFLARFSRRRVRGVVPEPRGSSRVARAHDQHGHGAVFQHVPAHRAEHGAAQRFEPETAGFVARADQHEVERVFFSLRGKSRGGRDVLGGPEVHRERLSARFSIGAT